MSIADMNFKERSYFLPNLLGAYYTRKKKATSQAKIEVLQQQLHSQAVHIYIVTEYQDVDCMPRLGSQLDGA